jgi:hypothetical protein
MQMIAAYTSQVNLPDTTTLAFEAQLDAQIKLQALLINAGFYPVYARNGFDCVHPATKLQFRVEFSDLAKPGFRMPELHADEAPTLDDTQAPADDEAMYAAWGATGTMVDEDLEALYDATHPVPSRRLTASEAQAVHEARVAEYHASRAN